MISYIFCEFTDYLHKESITNLVSQTYNFRVMNEVRTHHVLTMTKNYNRGGKKSSTDSRQERW